MNESVHNVRAGCERGGKKAIVIHPSPVTLNCRLTVCVIYLCATIKTKRKSNALQFGSVCLEFGVGFRLLPLRRSRAHSLSEKRKLCDKTVCQP